jgi:hypothetical protein
MSPKPLEKLDSWSNCGMHEKLRLSDKKDFTRTDFSLPQRLMHSQPSNYACLQCFSRMNFVSKMIF